MKGLATKGLAACLLLFSVASAAVDAATAQRTVPAPDPGQRQGRVEQLKARWYRIDLDRDGVISREEAQQGAPRLAERFDALDRDGDGQLSRQELRAAYRAREDRCRSR